MTPNNSNKQISLSTQGQYVQYTYYKETRL